MLAMHRALPATSKSTTSQPSSHGENCHEERRMRNTR
jgi:hypothetical protein